MKFQDINPFVRYSHFFTIENSTTFKNVIAYDHRLFYVAEGSGSFEIGGRLFPARKGSLFLFCSGLQYSLLPTENDPFQLYGVNFDFTSENKNLTNPLPPHPVNIFNCGHIIEHPEFSDMPDFQGVIVLNNTALEETLAQIDREYMTRKNYYELKLRSLMLSLLHEIVRCYSLLQHENDSSARVVDEIIDYICRNYSEDLTNRSIGEQFNFHPAYISRLMVRHAGIPLHQYLISYRLQVAINLLQSSNKSVTEISRQAGFKDVNYFSRCFKKRFGVSPKNYYFGS